MDYILHRPSERVQYIQSKYFSKMLEQNCPTCTIEFNYADRAATTVCNKKHVICRRCADEVARYGNKCPVCQSSSYSSNPYGVRESIEDRVPGNDRDERAPQNNANKGYGIAKNQVFETYPNQGFQPQQNSQKAQAYPTQNQNINRGQNSHNQGFQPQRQQPPAYNYNYPNNNFNQPQANPVQNQSNPVPAPPKIRFYERIQVMGCLLAVCGVLFFVLLSDRISMEECYYWGVYSCYYYEISGYQCCTYICPTNWYDSNCNSIYYYMDLTEVGFTTVGVAFFGSMAIACFILLIRAQRLNKQRRIQGAQHYVRV